MAGILKVDEISEATQNDGVVLNNTVKVRLDDNSTKTLLSTSGSNTTLNNITLGSNTIPSSSFMFRNKIINGDMRIDQRNSGNQSASNSAGSLYYGPDRFQLESDQAGKFNVQQNKGSQTPPSTFTKYYGVESLSAYSTGASNYTLVSHHIEGQNISDLKFGTAEAKTITLSFWVRSNVSGTNNVYVGSLRNGTYDRSFVFTYTINLPNTWEYKTITIPGDTSGTWATDNTAGIRISWDLGSGSNYQTSTTNAWLATNAFATASSTKMCATSGATLFLTGVQFEIGTAATPFEHRPIGMELSLCQRYAHFIRPQAAYGAIGVGRAWKSSGSQHGQGAAHVYLPVPMRGAIAIHYSDLTHFDLAGAGSGVSSLHNDGSTLQTVKVGWSRSSNVTSNVYYQLEFEDQNWQNAYLGFTSEL